MLILNLMSAAYNNIQQTMLAAAAWLVQPVTVVRMLTITSLKCEYTVGSSVQCFPYMQAHTAV